MKFSEMLVPWSFSRLESYEQCPHKFNAMSVAKTHTEEKSTAQLDGTDMHKVIEERVMRGKPLPLHWRYLEPSLAKFDKAVGDKYGEQKLALNNGFKQTGYFSNDTWLRVVLDFAIVNPAKGTAILVDWKSGKRISPDFTQQRIATLAFMIAEPAVKTARISYFWAAHNKMTHELMTRDDIPVLLRELHPRLVRYEQAHRAYQWPKRQHAFCTGCPVEDCEHYKVRRAR